MFSSNAGVAGNRYLVARTDVNHPLSAYSKFGFELDGVEWPSVEHYYQGMKFEEGEIRESIRSADHPEKASKLAKANKKLVRKDWSAGSRGDDNACCLYEMSHLSGDSRFVAGNRG